jgi:hypothetical protein
MKNKVNLNKLLVDAMSTLEKSIILRDNATWLSKQIDMLVSKHTDEEFDLLEPEEKDRIIRQMDELKGRLIVSMKDLIKLDEEYRSIAICVNKSTGEKLLEVLPPITLKDMLKDSQDE